MAGVNFFGVPPGARRPGISVGPTREGAFDYGGRIEVETSQVASYDYEIQPSGGVGDGRGPFTFELTAQGGRYLQLQETTVECEMSVVRSDGGKLSHYKDVVSPVNLLGAVMWDTVDVELNGQRFPGSVSSGASYKAYLEAMTSYNHEAARTHLRTQGYRRDSPGGAHVFKVPESTLRTTVRAAVHAGELPGPAYPPELTPRRDANGDDPRPICGVPLAAGQGGMRTAMREEQAEEEAVAAAAEDARLEEAAREVEEDPEGNAALHGNDRREPPDDDGGWGRGGANANEVEMASVASADDTECRLPPADLAARREEIWMAYYANRRAQMDAGLLVRSDTGRYNRAFEQGYRECAGSAIINTCSPITHDVFRMNNHLGPGNTLVVTLRPARDGFLLNTYQSARGYRLKLERVVIHTRAIQLLEKIPPPMKEVYLLTETQLHRRIVGQGKSTFECRMHHGGVLPKAVIFGMVHSRGVEGNYNFNPFNFYHFKLTHVNLKINSESHPLRGITTDFGRDNPLAARAYRWLFENSGGPTVTRGNLIDWDSFCHNSHIQMWDESVDRCCGMHNHQGIEGHMDLELSWAEPLPAPIYLIYELVYPKAMVLDKTNPQAITLTDIRYPATA